MNSKHEEENFDNRKHLQQSKWAILVFSSLLLMGDYYAYDVPFAIKEDLRSKFKESLSDEQFNYYFDLLYTVYVIPNIFLPLFNGILNQKFGDRRLLTVLGLIVLLGSIIVSFGSIIDSFVLMIIGRFIYGLGGDSITSSQWSLVLEYFHTDYEVGIAMSIIFIFTTSGSALNLYFSPIIVNMIGCNGVFLFTGVLCFFSLFFRYFLYKIDQNVLINIKMEMENNQSQLTELNDIQKINENNDLLKLVEEKNMNFFKRYCRMDERFWLNAIYWIFTLVSVDSLVYFSSNYFMTLWYPNLSTFEFHRKTTFFNFVSSVSSLVFVPLIGFLADKFCLHSQMALLSPLVLQMAFIFYILTSPMIPSIMYSFGISLNYTGVWANLAFCVDDKSMNLAVAIMYSLQNIISLTTPYIMYFVKSLTNSIEGSIYLMMIMNFFGMVFALKFHFEKEKQHLKYMELDEEKIQKPQKEVKQTDNDLSISTNI